MALRLADWGRDWNHLFVLIIGDLQGQDKCCGMYGSNNRNSISRCCDCTTEFADDHEWVCEYRTTKMILEMINRNAPKEEWQIMSMYNIQNAFAPPCMGGCPRGIFGITPVEILHQIKKGIMLYAMKLFRSDLTDQVLADLDTYLEKLFKYCTRREYARVSFTKGCIKVTNIKAEEVVGQVMMMVWQIAALISRQTQWHLERYLLKCLYY